MPELLKLEGIVAGYGEAKVLAGIDLALDEGRALALLGRNGTGKTTLINTIVGHTRRFAGRITLGGRDLTTLRPDQRAAAGIGWVPQERNIFKSLTVEENLTAVALPGPWNLQRVYDMFPRLRERRRQEAGTLSGGERQMLAVGRALMAQPALLMLDEPSLGLAPRIVREIFQIIARLRSTGVAILLVEQNARAALQVADYGYVLETGEIVLEGKAQDLAGNPRVIESYLGLGNAKQAVE